jgi:hypothetical protein
MMLTAVFALSLIVNVSAPADVPASIVADALVEANAIWRPSGTSFVWRRDSTLPAPLRVIISRATVAAKPAALPLGWVVFDAGAPETEIHLSYANAEQLFEESRSTIIHSPTRMTTQIEHHTLMARALGRALAHELGHILLASKEHTRSGLMKAMRSAPEFFSPDPRPFEITLAQRNDIAARLSKQPLVASR